MKKIVIADIKNEQIKGLFENFLDVIQRSLTIKDRNRNIPFYRRKPDKELRSLIENKEVLQFIYFESFIKNLQALEKNVAYLDTTEWEVLTFLSSSLIDSNNPVAVYEALDHLKKSEFLGKNNFSIIKVASIIYSLSQSDSFDAAKILVTLDHFDLLTEQNLSKIGANQQLNIILFSSILHKLSLSGGTNPLLTQANLDKLLQNSDLNLEVLAKFMQVEDGAKPLTQEKFDLVIENIDKIGTIAFDTKKLADIISLLDQAGILTQDNFDLLITLSKADFEKIIPVLDKIHERQILTQDNFLNFLNTFLDVSICDAKRDQVDGSFPKQSNIPNSLAERLCSTLVDFLSRVGKYFQNFFDDILNYFNAKAEKNETLNIPKSAETSSITRNHNSFFDSSYSGESENINTKLYKHQI